jgi:hypothetical protein
MRSITLLLILFSLSAGAADFRALDIGDSCAPIAAWEAAHSSTPTPWKAAPGLEVLAFEVDQFDRRILANYLCTKGVLLAGNYYFAVEPLEQAVETYREVYSRFLVEYGAPFSDSSPWNPRGGPEAVSPDPRRYMTSWRTARVQTVINVMPNWPTESSGWRLFVTTVKLRSTTDLTIGSSDRGTHLRWAKEGIDD